LTQTIAFYLAWWSLGTSCAFAQTAHTLKPTPKAVAWGYYDAKAAPVLRVRSGDTVEIQTLMLPKSIFLVSPAR